MFAIWGKAAGRAGRLEPGDPTDRVDDNPVPGA